MDTYRQHRQTSITGRHNRREWTRTAPLVRNSQFAIAAGYRFDYIAFKQNASPRIFQSVTLPKPSLESPAYGLASEDISAASICPCRRERTVSGAPFKVAWDVALHIESCCADGKLGGDYLYFHLAQDTGAYRAQSGSF